jgi:hypothetical protein
MVGESSTSFRLSAHRFLTQFAALWRDVMLPAELPGYRMLPVLTRWRLNCRTLWCFLRSAESLFMALCMIAWLLGSSILIWNFDLSGPVAALLPSLAVLWLLPWVASARRRWMRVLLGDHWGE